MTNNLYPSASSDVSGIKQTKGTLFPFCLIVLYLFLEYIRPQLLFPPLRVLHLPAITVILLLICLLFSGKIYIKDKQTILILLLLLEMVLHGPFARNNYWAFQIFYAMTITFIAYFGIINIVDDESKYEMLIKYWLILFLLLAIIGILNKGVGTGGFIGDENDFCMAINMVLPFALFGVFTANKQTGKVYFIILASLFMASILTYSRGGFIGMVSVIAYCWIRSKKKIAFSFIIGFLVLFALIVAPSSYWDRVQTITSEYEQNKEGTSQGTGGQRIYAWKLGWEMFLDNPIIGVGQGNYPWHVGITEDKLGMQWQTRSLAGRAAHSLYFTLLPELGAIGSLLYIAIIFYVLKDLKYIRNASINRKDVYTAEESKNIYYIALTLEGSLVGFLVSSVFISTLYYPNFWILCGFVVSLKKIVYGKCGKSSILKTNMAIKNAMTL
jgi:hypothetical protein